TCHRPSQAAFEGDAGKATAAGAALTFFLETLILEALGEAGFSAGPQVAKLAPLAPRREKVGRTGPSALHVEFQCLIDPRAERVLVEEIVGGCLEDERRHVEPDALPFEAAVHHPPQDRRPFGLE